MTLAVWAGLRAQGRDVLTVIISCLRSKGPVCDQPCGSAVSLAELGRIFCQYVTKQRHLAPVCVCAKSGGHAAHSLTLDEPLRPLPLLLLRT